MSGRIEFVPLGGAIDPSGNRPGIGGSAYALIDRQSSFALLVDCGAYPHSHEGRVLESAKAKELEGAAEASFSKVGDVLIPDMELFGSDLSGVVDVDLTELSELNMPSFEALKHVDCIAVIVTHAHVDHIGSLPFFAKVFPNAQIMMTSPTLDICRWSWNDSLRIAGAQNHELLYDALDIFTLQNRVKFIAPDEQIELGPFSVRFYRAGHILGAIGVYVMPSSNATAMPRIFFTGDGSLTPQHTIDSAEFPTEPVDILITETTYCGTSESKDRAEVEAQVAKVVRNCLEQGGRVLCPVLTVGRSAELYATLQEHGIVDDFPVYIDGAARLMAEIYDAHGCMPSGMLERCLVGNARRNSLMASNESHVVLVSGGMLNGLAIPYAGKYGPREEDLILYSSYLSQCSHAARMLETKPGERLILRDPQSRRMILDVELNASVMQIGLVAHFSHKQTLEFTDQLHPSQTFTVHGDESSMNALISDSRLPMEKALLNQTYVL